MLTVWFVLIGALFIAVALIGTAVNRLPLSSGLIYLLIGLALGPGALNLLRPDAFLHSEALRFAFEITVLLAIFTVGLKLRVPFVDGVWIVPVTLATTAMIITIAGLGALGFWVIGLPLGAAVLFAAILAPTDPVLASDIQIKNPAEPDHLRFSVTAEGGLNDGTAFPFVQLGLGLLGMHELGPHLWRWIAVDVLWGVVGGLLIGALCGVVVGKLLVFLRRRRQEPFELEEFVSLGLIALSYGLAQMAGCLGFLAVLSAGMAMPRLHHKDVSTIPATHSEKQAQVLPRRMVASVLGFNERLERIAEVGAVLLLGSLLSDGFFSILGVGVAVVLIFVLRPIAVFIGVPGKGMTRRERFMIAWFGVRGVGSLYYLMYAIGMGLPESLANELLPLVLTVIAVSIVVHGISATPLMNLHSRLAEKKS